MISCMYFLVMKTPNELKSDLVVRKVPNEKLGRQLFGNSIRFVFINGRIDAGTFCEIIETKGVSSDFFNGYFNPRLRPVIKFNYSEIILMPYSRRCAVEFLYIITNFKVIKGFRGSSKLFLIRNEVRNKTHHRFDRE